MKTNNLLHLKIVTNNTRLFFLNIVKFWQNATKNCLKNCFVFLCKIFYLYKIIIK